MTTKIRLILVFITMLVSCATVKVPVSEAFSKEATRVSIKGLDGWMGNQKLQLGDYETSVVKRGWDFSSSVQYSKFRQSPEEALLQVFNIDTRNDNIKQKNYFQYTIGEASLLAEVYATEKFSEKQLIYKSNNPFIGSASATKKYDYSFAAAIVPVSDKQQPAWSLVLINTYNITNDKGKTIFDKSDVKEEGYATNGDSSIAIRPLRLRAVNTKAGKERKVLGGKLLGGYELLKNNEVICVIDILDKCVWLHNSLQPAEKLVISSIASAILLKRLQDVGKDT